MLFLQFLNVPERCLRMWPDTIVSMQQHFLQTAIHAHALVLGQILQKSGKTLLQPHRHVHPLDLYWRAGVEQVMPKRKIVSIQVPHDVVADSVGPVVDRFRHRDVVGAWNSYSWSASPTRKYTTQLFGSGVPFRRNICTLPRFTPANVGGSPQVNARL